MIIGSCVHCDRPMMIGIPDGASLPAFVKHDCEECGKTMWTRLSRVNPTSWDEEGFEEEFNIDHENRSITPKDS